MEGAGSEGARCFTIPQPLTPGPWHTCLALAALPRGDGGQVPADRVRDNAGIGHALVSWSQRNPQHLSIREEAAWFNTKVNGPLPSPAVCYVTDVGGPTGQEHLAGLGRLSVS